MAADKQIEFLFDYGSPFSYVAEMIIDDVANRNGATITRTPILLGGVHKATENKSPFLETCEPKRNYGGLTMQRWVAHHGITLNPNPAFPINTLAAMRMAVAAQHLGVFEKFHLPVFKAFWVDQKDMGDMQVFASVLQEAGLDAEQIFTTSQEQHIKDELKKNTENAVSRGVFGAPSFFFDGQLYFGQDHLIFLEAALQAA